MNKYVCVFITNIKNKIVLNKLFYKYKTITTIVRNLNIITIIIIIHVFNKKKEAGSLIVYYLISSSGALVPGLLPWAKPPSGLWQDDCCVPGWGGLRWGLRSGHGSPALCPMEPSRQLRHLHGRRGDPAAPPHPTGEAQSGHVSRWEDGERAHSGPPHRLLQDTRWDRLWKLLPCQAGHPRSDERCVS